MLLIVAGGGVTANIWWQSAAKVQSEAEQNKSAQSKATTTTDNGYRSFGNPKDIRQFSLDSSRLSPFTNQDLLGQWTIVVFGYTYCPDVCPTTLARLKGVYGQLKAIAPMQVVFVSADPLRDDIARLTQYINYFEPEFIAVTANHDKLFPFAQSLLLPYGIIAIKPNDDYAVSHSASIALINPQGKLVGQFKPRHQLGAIAVVDMKLLASTFASIVVADVVAD